MRYFIPRYTKIQRIWWGKSAYGNNNIITDQDFVFTSIQVAGARTEADGSRMFDNILRYDMPTITIEVNKEYSIDVNPKSIIKV